MKNYVIPILLAFLISACADTGPSGPLNFTDLYQGASGGEPMLVVYAEGFDPAKPEHWKHAEEYSEWALKRILGLQKTATVYVVDNNQIPAPHDGPADPLLQQHTIARGRWLPSQDAKFERDPFNTHTNK